MSPPPAARGLEPPYGDRDPGDMAGRIDGIPEQIEAAVEALDAAPWPPPARAPSLLAVGAVGGSAIAADLTAALYADRLPRPLVVVRDTRWPGWVGERGLALLCSHSGDTAETLALYRDAGARGIARLALTRGGALADACARDGVVRRGVAAGPPPRAAMYAAWVAVTGLVHALGWIADPRPEWRAAAVSLRALRARAGPGAPAAENPAKQLARSLAGCDLDVYSGPALAAVAARLRQQLNENAKLPARSAVAPELNHNEIVGWEHAAPADRRALLVLADREDDPAVTRRLALTAEYAAARGAVVLHLPEADGARLVRHAAAAMFGDYVSFYLALARGVDPTPIASIDEFKRRLAAAGDRRDR